MGEADTILYGFIIMVVLISIGVLFATKDNLGMAKSLDLSGTTDIAVGNWSEYNEDAGFGTIKLLTTFRPEVPGESGLPTWVVVVTGLLVGVMTTLGGVAIFKYVTGR